MKIKFRDEGYRSPLCSIFRLDEEADICAGTNTPGAGNYDDDDENNDLGNI